MIAAVSRHARRASAAVCLVLAVPGAAKTITVTPATFNSAVASAKGGDTLALVGTFGNIRIVNRDFASAVTINASRATFTGTMTLNNVDNLTVSGGTFNISGAPAYTKAAAVYGGRNITFNAATMIGTTGGEGITFSGTTGAIVTNSTFSGLQVAVVLGSVTHGVATQNTIVGAVSDGIDIANSHSVTASYNSCSGGNPGPRVHPDCVQLWSVTGQPLQSDIIVRNNTATGPTQGFTAFASMGGELRVQIVHNGVDTSYPQGIACYDCVNSSISYNTLTTLTGALHLTNLNIIGGAANSVVGNVITPYTPGHAGSHFARLGVALGIDPGIDPGMDLAIDPGIDPDVDPGIDETPNLAALVGSAPDDAGVAAIPEPSGWALLVAGFAAVGIVHRRAARRAVAA